jgi:hypothetical protein
LRLALRLLDGVLGWKILIVSEKTRKLGRKRRRSSDVIP